MPLVERGAPQVHLYFFGTPDLIGSRFAAKRFRKLARLA
jgi:hypothetical protein